MLELLCQQRSSGLAVLGPGARCLAFDDDTRKDMLQLDGRGGFVLNNEVSVYIGAVNHSGRTIFWPPGPLPLTKASSISASSTLGRGGNCFEIRMEALKYLTALRSGCLLTSKGSLET